MMGGTAPRYDEEASDDLVRRVRGGETEAFATLVRRHQAEVWKVVLAVAPWGDEAATENLVQQTFVNAYERLSQYRPGDLGLWLKAIARNLVREELRRKSRETNRMRHYRSYVAALYENDDEAEASDRALERAVAACRESLAPAAAQALALRYDQALGLGDVAAAIGRTLAATQQLLHRTRAAVRVCVERRLAVE